MVGFEGREGGLVDNFKIICATLNSNGTLSNVSVVNTQVGSSSGGSYYYETFSSPVAMVGSNVRVGDELDALTGRGNTIANIAASSSNTSYTNSLSQLGSSGGSSNNDFAPNGNVFVGIRYRSGPYGGGVQFIYAPITVCTPATAPTSITGTTTICSGSNTTLTASGGTLGTGGYYQWYANGCGSGSSLGSGASITVNPTTSTTYYVRRVANCGGTTGCYSVTVNVNASSTAPTSITGSNTICSGSNVTLTANGGTGSLYEWGTGGTIGNNIISGATGSTYSPSPTTTTTYWVRRKQSSPCSGNTGGVTFTVTVNSPATAPTSISGTSNICPGNSVVLTANGGTGSVYQWGTGAVGSNIISGATDATYTVSPSATTTYWVRRVQQSPCSGFTNGVTFTLSVASAASTTTLALTNGDYVWQGGSSTNLKSAANWIVFTSPNTYSIATNDVSSTKNVFIPQLSTCFNNSFPVLSQPMITSSNTAVKNITILENAVLTVDDEDLEVFGNWVNNGIFDHSNVDQKVDFKHATNIQAIGGSSLTEFYNLEISENNLNNVVLNNNIFIKNDFDFDGNRKFELGGFNITFLGSATITGESNLRYFVTNSTGVVKRTLSNSTLKEFPVGINTYNLCMLNNTGTSDVFSVRVIENVTNDGSGIGVTTAAPVVKRTWMVDELVTGGSVVDLRLYWNGASEEINGFDIASQFVAHHNNVDWENIGATNNSTAPLYIQKDNISSFSPFSIGSLGGSALPVELTSFNAICEEGKGVNVTWSTASEHNSSYFDLLKSEDGFQWRTIASIDGAGNSTSSIDYSIYDADKSDIIYYKLMQYDMDGKSEEYGPISVECSSISEMLVKTYPNPSSEDFYIELVSNEETTTEISILDAQGKLTYSRIVDTEKGTNVYYFEKLFISPGMYYIQLSNDLTTPSVVKHSFR